MDYVVDFEDQCWFWHQRPPENALELIESAGRTCYKSESTETSAADFVKSIVKRGHLSVIEHISAGVRIITDRGVSHELVRHRLASYSQESTRYCNYSSDKFDGECTFIKPPGLDTIYKNEIWEKSCKNSESDYFNLLEAGCSPQIARSVLPTCLKTEVVMACNFREWRHFIKLRGSKAAHPQIRPIARMIFDELIKHSQSTFGDLINIFDLKR